MLETMGQGDTVRLLAFVGMFALMSFWEAFVPFRERGVPRWLRWGSNLALLFVGNLLLRLVVPLTVVGFAIECQQEGRGLLNSASMPIWLSFILSIALLDMGIYFQHRLFHIAPILWRVHRVHHADTEFDVSTALRFHPFETALSLFFKLAMIRMIGPYPAAVLAFEIVLNASAMFNHANIRLPWGVDKAIRSVIVTPDMHRIHHSTRATETNSNFGFSLSLWDRLFGTYCGASKEPQQTMAIGLSAFRNRREAWLDRLLLQPFTGDGGRH